MSIQLSTLYINTRYALKTPSTTKTLSQNILLFINELNVTFGTSKEACFLVILEDTIFNNLHKSTFFD